MFALLTAARKALAGAGSRVSQPRRRLVLALPALTLLAACEPGMGGLGTGPSVSRGEAVPVALLVPKGTGNSGDAILAASLENSARLAMTQLNGAKIDLRVYDTAGNAATTAAVTEQAISEGAKIILGPVYAGNANAAGNVAKRHGVNVLAFSNNADIAGGNVFILGPTFLNTAKRLTAYATRQGKQRIVTVYGNTPEGQAGAAAIATAASQAGATVSASVPYEFSQQGVLDAMPSVTAAASGGQADAIFLTANAAGALPLLAQLLPENGLDPSVTQYIGLTRWDIPPQTLDLPGVQGGWFALPDPNASSQFKARYSAAYGQDPHPIGGLGFDGIAAIGALVSSGRSNALSASSLTQGAGFQGATGVFRLLPDGSNERGLAIATIQNHQVQMIDPAPASFGGFGF
ncbi:penicillin-binding protein activator [Pseudooceanicola sp. HF7]|uniref:penicillin-binding protein activator n=1 Tax=Pseudooceanicola sp. HF7 TaxID=2721560 RepID=UPI001430C85B|nr:penicillin-binding protein activator [Pseudooceanicola sp. HF7]NIZ08883.1 penicillin-binding protein activator [Pseudooceanicola sp. HF7]